MLLITEYLTYVDNVAVSLVIHACFVVMYDIKHPNAYKYPELERKIPERDLRERPPFIDCDCACNNIHTCVHLDLLASTLQNHETYGVLIFARTCND